MTYRVIPVSSSSQMKDFLRLPFMIYRDDQNWVAPIVSEVRRVLDKKKNPYFARARLKLFICYKEKIPVSRVAIIINRIYQEKYGVRSAFFGFFESKNDLDAVRFLFDAIDRYCRNQRIESIEGPFNPNHYSEIGLQASQYGTVPTFFQPYNPEYYHKLLENIGYRVSAKLYTLRNGYIADYVLHRYGVQNKMDKIGEYTIRPLSNKNLEAELERFREVNNDAFSSNWHFIPLSKEEYLFSAKFLNLVTRPGLIQIVEHKGKPVGVFHCVLDINPLLKMFNGVVGPLKYIRFMMGRRKIRKLVIFSLGIKKAYRHTIVYKLLLSAFCHISQEYEEVETTWISDENTPVVKASEHLGLKPDKEFVMYKKELT